MQPRVREVQVHIVGCEGAAQGGPAHKQGVRRRTEKLHRRLSRGGRPFVLKDKDGAGMLRPLPRADVMAEGTHVFGRIAVEKLTAR